VRVSDQDGESRRLVRLTRSNAAGSTRAPAADCATAQRDPVLGTLQLEAGFSVVDSAALPEGVGAVTAIPVAP
jgi:hypothetical protein